ETGALSALSSIRAEQQKLIVDRHNALRREVKPTASNMMKMEWSPPAAENAQNWANHCILRHSLPSLRRTNVQCGENLFMSSVPFSWSHVLQAWYNEKKNFEYGIGAKKIGAVFGHYTQQHYVQLLLRLPVLPHVCVTCGENVLLSHYPRTWADTIQVWYSQSSNFKYGYGAISKNVNVESYTQLIWYNSYKVGCGVSYCPTDSYKYFYVCQYCPAGNNPMQIAMPYRSGPRCADCPGQCDKGLCTNPCKYQDLLENCKNLKTLFGCSHSLVKKQCPASCKCTTQII
ncbi:hypothetical protein IHE44_0009793, partial [Lamprotornis superbus]